LIFPGLSRGGVRRAVRRGVRRGVRGGVRGGRGHLFLKQQWGLTPEKERWGIW